MRTPRQVISCVALFIVAAVVALGQVYTGSIAGTVKDPSGAVVPNAKVSITDTGKGFTHTGVSAASGIFTGKNLPPATYTERVDVAGFSPFERPGIVLDVAGNVNADVTLEVANAGQTVTVTEARSEER